MITCYNLSLEYIEGKKVLRDISLKIPEGSFHFLTGSSGAGKSSLMYVLALSMRHTSGRLKMFGKDISELPESELPDLRKQIGVVRQDFQLLDHLSVAENVGLPLKVSGQAPEVIKRKTEEMLDWIGLGDCYEERPSTLSGGQQQRVAIARAVVNNPSLLIADEPSGNLDPHLSKRLMNLFEALNSMGTTVIFATHDETLVNASDHPVLEIKGGSIREGRRAEAA